MFIKSMDRSSVLNRKQVGSTTDKIPCEASSKTRDSAIKDV